MQDTEKKSEEILEEPVETPAQAAQTSQPSESQAEDKTAKKPKKEKKSSVEERLKAELDRAQAEAEDLKRKWYAVTAEYENYRRRTQNQAAQRYAEGRNDVVSSLFSIGDNLERALAACADENVKQGLDMVLKSFKKVLEGEGVEEIDPLGQPFDADVAEAIMAQPAADGEESGMVKQVFVKGYKKGDKVLRYAQVIVTQ
ncbi:MAG: nucleotide exchange factor GrpE [Clostridia bacterium]|nr:nucleotide exchange factor GrpE [Clostridia bacterium]